MKILVTGAHGLLGSSILRCAGAESSKADGAAELIGCGRGAEPVFADVEYHQIDLLDAAGVRQLLAAVEPQWQGRPPCVTVTTEKRYT